MSISLESYNIINTIIFYCSKCGEQIEDAVEYSLVGSYICEQCLLSECLEVENIEKKISCNTGLLKVFNNHS